MVLASYQYWKSGLPKRAKSRVFNRAFAEIRRMHINNGSGFNQIWATMMKVDGKTFVQSDAMYEWAAKKANLIPEDPEKALAMRMVVGKR